MHVALSGYFWDQPRTGSGQYLRHLWTALPELFPSAVPPWANGEDTFTILLPKSRPFDEPVPASRRFKAIYLRLPATTAKGRSPSPLARLAPRNEHLGKLLWEELEVVGEARRHAAQVLHVPYLSAPLARGTLGIMVTAHDMIPWVVPGYRGSALFRLYLALAAAGVRRADLIVADSEASRRDAIRVLRLPTRKVRTIYLGMEPHPDYTQEELSEVRARFNLPESFAFYLGGFDRRKNVPLLLRAWRTFIQSGNCGAVLAIGGAVPKPGSLFPDIRAEARALGFDDDESGPVRFLGKIGEEEKPLLMAAACVFIYPSAYEGFGLDPLEAMSVGCPVVSSSGGSLSEVVGEGGLLVLPGDEHALSQAIARIWCDESLHASLSPRGREQAAHFTWERTARETLEAYRTTLRRARKRRRG